jgi:ArsR family transcriptional regulator
VTQVTNIPATPRQAARKRHPLDRLLDASTFRALADPTRARLLACLVKCARRCSVTEIAQCCDVDFSVVARHLAHLARADLVDAHKIGRTVWYSAKSREIAQRLHALADAIDQWRQAAESCCSHGGDCA